MTASDIKAKYSCAKVLIERGFHIDESKRKPVLKCPFHSDKSPSFSLDLEKDVWTCFAGCGGGSVIDLIAKFEGIDPKQYLRNQAANKTHENASKTSPDPFEPSKPVQVTHLKEKARYTYLNENGKRVYESIRYEPKTFKQGHFDASDKFVWGMDGVERVLYRLPQVRKAQQVWIVEGEKDVESLEKLGFTATCNVGGAGKWLESYGEHLTGKDLILCGDSDEPGKKHIETVEKMVAPVAKTIRRITLPPGNKDVTDFLDSIPDDSEAIERLNELIAKTEPLYQGEKLPLFSMEELESDYVAFLNQNKERCLHLGKWLPALNEVVLVPGEMATIMAETGIGKSALATNLFLSNCNLTTLVFGMELAKNKVFTRTIQTAVGVSRHQVENYYRQGSKVAWRETNKLSKMMLCPDSGMTLEKMDSIIRRSELKTGEAPAVVIVDYIQLMGASKNMSRYDRFSEAAEGMKRMAKERNVVIVVISQVNRDKERGYGTMSINDAKESGSIENSSGLVLGATRNPDNKSEMCIQVLKSTETGAGAKIYCHFEYESMRITQKGEFATEEPTSMPPSHYYNERDEP